MINTKGNLRRCACRYVEGGRSLHLHYAPLASGGQRNLFLGCSTRERERELTKRVEYRENGQRHEDALDAGAGRVQAELGAAIVDQVELDVAAAPQQLRSFFFYFFYSECFRFFLTPSSWRLFSVNLTL